MAKSAEQDCIAALLCLAAQLGISDSPPSPSLTLSTNSGHPSSFTSSFPCLGHSLFVFYFPDAGGRGLAAARDLEKGELILRVPKAALFTTDSAMADAKLASCLERHRHRLSPVQMLAVSLLAEVGKGRSSQWYPYLENLPRSYDTLANFTNFEVKAFQVEDAIGASEKAIALAKSDWKEAVGVLKELDLKPQFLTFSSWRWASATVSSRTLHIPWDSAGCLCPIGDLFNYAAPDEEHSPENSEDTHPDVPVSRLTDGGYEESKSSYCFYARKNYKQGEQVLLGYGTYTNLELLEHYGFLLKENPNDKVFIDLNGGMCTSTSWPKDSLYIQPDGTPSFALLCALRLWATPAKLRKTIGSRIYSGSLVSVENERLIMKWLAKRCTCILGRLNTTIGEDNRLLSKIDRMIDQYSCLGSTETLYQDNEIRDFFQAHGIKEEGYDHIQLLKVRRYLERWKLAIEWRVAYKKILQSCVFYCENMVCCLPIKHA
ncbi:protein SET DOMAIN GROUP 40-like [Zingiber officinale]|uniref:protein SET DOMAIN GROUP 40-like n=1 Tax=Zingiber officinale TaxID=94328 RepID=UPI001C4D17B7|nr:protein SET DOMAIN GROUP 40-like [Zingiber officinale]